MSTELSVSTWSLHRALGPTYWDKPSDPSRDKATPWGAGNITLLELPAKLNDYRINTLEICHFHLPSREASYLHELRVALDEANIRLFSVLIDDGDITDPEHAQRDIDWIAGWLETAGQLGSERARVIAGKTTGKGALERSRAGLAGLVDVAKANNIRLMTENWFDVLATPNDVSAVMNTFNGEMSLCADFGNWKGATKYDHLAQIMQYAESCHTKCYFPQGLEPDRADYVKCLELTKEAGFNGPYTLIYDGPDDDEWAGLTVEREMVQPYIH